MAISRTLTNIIVNKSFFNKSNIIDDKLDISENEELPISEEEESTINSMLIKQKLKNRNKARKKRFINKVSLNAYKYMWTITQNRTGSRLNANDRYITKIDKYLTNSKIAHVIVPEEQKNGILHWHIVLEDKPKIIDKFGKQYSTKLTSEYSTHVLKQCGLNWFIPMPNFYDYDYMLMVRYLSKYLTKQGHEIIYSHKLSPKENIYNIIESSDIKRNGKNNVVNILPVEELKELRKMGFTIDCNEQIGQNSNIDYVKYTRQLDYELLHLDLI